jgi:hypothetical protein
VQLSEVSNGPGQFITFSELTTGLFYDLPLDVHEEAKGCIQGSREKVEFDTLVVSTLANRRVEFTEVGNGPG